MPVQTLTLLSVPIAGAVTAVIAGPYALDVDRVASLILRADFAYGSAGTTLKAWVQTSFDGGLTWADIANFAFTTAAKIRMYNLTTAAVTTIATPTDGTLADDTAVNGFLGAMFRVKYTSTGTYAGATSITIVAQPR